MTIEELEQAVWDAGAVVKLTGQGEPLVLGDVPAAVLDATREHRDEVHDRLRGLRGARLQGLVCGKCAPCEAVAEQWRICPKHGNVLHYPRVP